MQGSQNVSNFTSHILALRDKLAKEEQSNDFPAVIFMSFLSVLGTIGNAILLDVFAHAKKKVLSTYFIVTLASIDLFISFIVIPFRIMLFYVPAPLSVCGLFVSIAYTAVSATIVLFICIGVDRYQSVCLIMNPVLTMKHVKYLLLWAFFGSVYAAVIAPLYIKGDVTLQEQGESITLYMRHEHPCYVTSLLSHPKRGWDLRYIVHFVFGVSFIVVISFVSALYIRVFLTLRDSDEFRLRSRSSVLPTSVSLNGRPHRLTARPCFELVPSSHNFPGHNIDHEPQGEKWSHRSVPKSAHSSLPRSFKLKCPAKIFMTEGSVGGFSSIRQDYQQRSCKQPLQFLPTKQVLSDSGYTPGGETSTDQDCHKEINDDTERSSLGTPSSMTATRLEPVEHKSKNNLENNGNSEKSGNLLPKAQLKNLGTAKTSKGSPSRINSHIEVQCPRENSTNSSSHSVLPFGTGTHKNINDESKNLNKKIAVKSFTDKAFFYKKFWSSTDGNLTNKEREHIKNKTPKKEGSKHKYYIDVSTTLTSNKFLTFSKKNHSMAGIGSPAGGINGINEGSKIPQPLLSPKINTCAPPVLEPSNSVSETSKPPESGSRRLYLFQNKEKDTEKYFATTSHTDNINEKTSSYTNSGQKSLNLLKVCMNQKKDETNCSRITSGQRSSERKQHPITTVRSTCFSSGSSNETHQDRSPAAFSENRKLRNKPEIQSELTTHHKNNVGSKNNSTRHRRGRLSSAENADRNGINGKIGLATYMTQTVSIRVSLRLMVVTLTYSLCWLPFYLIELGLVHYNYSIQIFLLANVMNPIVHFLSSKKFRHDAAIRVKQFFKLRKPSTH